MSRIKKALSVNVPHLFGTELLSAALKHQSRYGFTPWQPGEIPGRNGTLISVSEPLDMKPMPYGEFLGVQKPENRGKGYDLLMDVEGEETQVKRGVKV